MSRPTLRYRLGTARRGLRTRLLDLRGRLRRSPSSAPVVPRPRIARGTARLRLTHALVASDLNPRYLAFWPLVRRAWREIAGLEPVLVLIAAAAEIPEDLRDRPDVVPFEPVAGVHTAFQAQCIRLLYPALLDTDGAVLVSDVDMAPMNRRYFHRPAEQVDAGHFLAYRDVLLEAGEIPVCYNAARPKTWSRVFGVEGPEDVRSRLAAWAGEAEYSGLHGGEGWGTDQRILHRTLLDHGRRTGTVWILDDHYTGFRRLERAVLRKRGELYESDRRLIARGAYSDFHCVQPFEEFREPNELAVELAIDAAQRLRTRRSTPG